MQIKYILFASLFFCSVATSEELKFRFANLPLLPEQKPNIELFITNCGSESVTGDVALNLPDDWQIVPEKLSVEIAPGHEKRFLWTIAEGKANAGNLYCVSATLETQEGKIFFYQQKIFTASAPNSRLSVDATGARLPESVRNKWEDAIPITTQMVEDADNTNNPTGKTIEVRTVWSKKRFSFLIGIENFELATGDSPSAIQVAIGVVKSDRSYGPLYQFLLYGDENSPFIIPLKEGAEHANFSSIANELGASVNIGKQDGFVWFEGAIDFKSLPELKPSEGREMTFSLLIHDPKNQTVYDWGRVCHCPLEDNDSNTGEKWIRWNGDSITNTLCIPRSGWSMCSSKY